MAYIGSNYSYRQLLHQKRHSLKRWRNNVMRAASTYSQQFALRQKSYENRHTTKRKTGKLDIKRLHAYRTSEDLFKNKSILPKGKNHMVTILIDASGSMTSMNKSRPMSHCMFNAAALGYFMYNAKIPFQIYTYTSGMGNKPSLINLFSEETKSVTKALEMMFLIAEEFDISGYLNNSKSVGGANLFAGTPIATSTALAHYTIRQRMRKYKPQNNIFMLMSDGGSNDIAEGPVVSFPKLNAVYPYIEEDAKSGFRYRDPVTHSILKQMQKEGIHTIFLGYIGNGVASLVNNQLTYKGEYNEAEAKEFAKWKTTVPHTNKSGIISVKDLGHYSSAVLVPSNYYQGRAGDNAKGSFKFDTSSYTADGVAKSFEDAASSKQSEMAMAKIICEEICKVYT